MYMNILWKINDNASHTTRWDWYFRISELSGLTCYADCCLLGPSTDAGGHHSSRLARGPTRLSPRPLARCWLISLRRPPARAPTAPPELISHSHSPARQLLMGDERSALDLRVKPATRAAQLEWEWLHFTSQNKPFNLTLVFIPHDLSNENDSPTSHLIASLLFINKDGNSIKDVD